MKALPNSLKFSYLMKNAIGNLLSSKNSLRIDEDKRTGGTSLRKATDWKIVPNW